MAFSVVGEREVRAALHCFAALLALGGTLLEALGLTGDVVQWLILVACCEAWVLDAFEPEVLECSTLHGALLYPLWRIFHIIRGVNVVLAEDGGL
jgi:hypothetical protein